MKVGRLNQILAALVHAALFVLLVILIWFTLKYGPLIQKALWNTSQATWKVNKAADAEIAHFNNQLQETEKATNAVKRFFDETGCSLNGCRGLFGRKEVKGLLPQATSLLAKVQYSMETLDVVIKHLDEVVVSTKGEVDSLHVATDNLAKSISDLDGIIADPRIKEELAELLQLTKDIDEDSKQLGLLLKSGTATAEDIRMVADKIREQYLKARNLYYAIAKELLGIGSEGVQFFLKK